MGRTCSPPGSAGTYHECEVLGKVWSQFYRNPAHASELTWRERVAAGAAFHVGPGGHADGRVSCRAVSGPEQVRTCWGRPGWRWDGLLQ